MDQLPFTADTLQAFGTNSFAENPTPRVPCVLVLDVSGSMAGEPIRELNAGLRVYKDELSADSQAIKSVEVAIVTFGDDVRTACDFTTAEAFVPPTLEPSGMTPMGRAVNQAIDMIEARKQNYKANGIAYHRPWIFMISDGAPNDDGWESAAARAVSGDQQKKFAFFCVGVEGANIEILNKFCVREPLKLQGLRFRDLFKWLSSSQRSVSRSTPGDDVPLENPTGPSGWAVV